MSGKVGGIRYSLPQSGEKGKPPPEGGGFADFGSSGGGADLVYTDDEIEQWNQLCNNDLDIFLWHSDYDGKLTPKECKKIYNELKKLKIKDLPYSDKWTMQELWLNMLKHCYKHRVNMYFY